MNLSAITDDTLSESANDVFGLVDSEESASPSDEDEIDLSTEIEIAESDLSSQFDLHDIDTIVEQQNKIVENTERSADALSGILFCIILALGIWGAFLFGRWIWSLLRC